MAGRGLYTCFQCSAQWASRIMVNENVTTLPKCSNCGIHASWVRGK